jgi:hypothetical protein
MCRELKLTDRDPCPTPLQVAADIQARREAALAAAAASRTRIREERNGVPLPDPAEILARLREGRNDELSGLR